MRMFSRSVCPFVLALAAGGLSAQGSYTAYPIDSLHGAFGHWAPFGILSTGNADECRVQQLIPPQYLPPGGALINGIAVSPHVTGNVPYERLIIRCGLTPATTLSTTFAANAASLQTVYSNANFSINWTSSTSQGPVKVRPG